MARNRRLILSSPSEVWRLLCDGHRYGEWVTGTQQVLAADPHWPGRAVLRHPLTHRSRGTSRPYGQSRPAEAGSPVCFQVIGEPLRRALAR